jgi:hypothetical protein
MMEGTVPVPPRTAPALGDDDVAPVRGVIASGEPQRRG